MRVVLDSNVLLSAFGTRGLCEALFELCTKRHQLCLSEPILDELAEHLPGKFKMPMVRVTEIVRFLKDEALLVKPARVPASACRDRDDLAVLGTAVASKAECIVTGDKDLLVLGKYRGIPILSPRAFYDRLK